MQRTIESMLYFDIVGLGGVALEEARGVVILFIGHIDCGGHCAEAILQRTCAIRPEAVVVSLQSLQYMKL